MIGKEETLSPEEIATLQQVASENILSGLNGTHMRKLRELKLIENHLSGIPVVSAKGSEVLRKARFRR